MMEYICTVYGYGYDVEVIAYDVDKTKDEVLETLREFKRKNHKRKCFYSEELISLIVNRFKNGFSPYNIECDLRIGNGIVKKLLKKEGIEVKNNRKRKTKKDYEVIDHHDFMTCPCCGSKKVKDLNIFNDEDNLNPQSYCLKCGTEWYLENNEVRKVLFHELDIDF